MPSSSQPFDLESELIRVNYHVSGIAIPAANRIKTEFERLEAENRDLKIRNDWLELERKNIKTELRRHPIPEEYQRELGQVESSIVCFLTFTGRDMLDVMIKDLFDAREKEIAAKNAEIQVSESGRKSISEMYDNLDRKYQEACENEDKQQARIQELESTLGKVKEALILERANRIFEKRDLSRNIDSRDVLLNRDKQDAECQLKVEYPYPWQEETRDKEAGD